MMIILSLLLLKILQLLNPLSPILISIGQHPALDGRDFIRHSFDPLLLHTDVIAQVVVDLFAGRVLGVSLPLEELHFVLGGLDLLLVDL